MARVNIHNLGINELKWVGMGESNSDDDYIYYCRQEPLRRNGVAIIPSKEIPGLISFRMDWLDLLVVQGTLKSLLQHHSSKASILQRSAFFTAQLSHPYMTTGKTIALTRRTFVGKVMSLILNMLSRLVITFLPRSKCLLISWLQSPSVVILEPRKIKSDTVSTVSPKTTVTKRKASWFLYWPVSQRHSPYSLLLLPIQKLKRN